MQKRDDATILREIRLRLEVIGELLGPAYERKVAYHMRNLGEEYESEIRLDAIGELLSQDYVQTLEFHLQNVLPK